MKPRLLANLCADRVHNAWVVLAVTFSMTPAVVGARAAPGVMIVPLQRAFGWNVGVGTVRGLTGSYMLAFLTSGLACLLASLLVLRIARAPALAIAAE